MIFIDKLRALSLFSGCGAYDLGLEWAGGFDTVGFVEVDPYCQDLLADRFPGVPIFGDVREFDPAQIPGTIDLIHGGFPCQDISAAGRGAGIEGERSSLWAEFARCICLARPQYALVENVPILTRRGLGVVLGCLAFGGYDAEWDCISALSLGCIYQDPAADPDGTIRFQHRNRLIVLATLPDADREQLWLESESEPGSGRPAIVADDGEAGGLEDPGRERREAGAEIAGGIQGLSEERDAQRHAERPDTARSDAEERSVADPISDGRDGEGVSVRSRGPYEEDTLSSGRGKGVGQADAHRHRFKGDERARLRKQNAVWCDTGILERADRDGRLREFRERTYECWAAEPCLRSVPARTPDWMDEIRLCGNTNPPQLFQYLGELIQDDNRARKKEGVRHDLIN